MREDNSGQYRSVSIIGLASTWFRFIAWVMTWIVTLQHTWWRIISLGTVSLLISVSAWSDNFNACSQNFYAAVEPVHIKQSLLKDSVPLCFTGFATLYSGITRTPIWSAEHLTRERLYQAEDIPREDSFHSEKRLSEDMQAQLADYKGSGYDRGHLAPNADMANIEQQYDSFSLANMIPQAPKNNRYVWRNLESVTRFLTKKHGDVYVVTGASFQGKKIVKINNRVLVPSHVFKAIYIPSTNEAGAYYAPNDDTERVEVMSLDELTTHIGIDVFPTLSPEVKSNVMPLAMKLGDISDRSLPEPEEVQEDPLWLQIIIEILKWIVDSISTSK